MAKQQSKQSIKGIYTIKCKDNGKVYVGKATDIYQRWRSHQGLLNKDKHQNKDLQADWNKYGSDRFEFAILHRWQKGEDLSVTEEIWIGHLQPAYNIIRGKRA